jgi:aminoglycoside phosphotransferase (APT) family kinase protein
MKTTPLRNVAQQGLRWQKGLFTAKPVWTNEPSIPIMQALVARHLQLEREAPGISFFAEGAFNKLYAVDCTKGRFIFRVALPVAPKAKTLSEVATLAFVQAKTTIPVPSVIAYDANLTNALGFEWILMSRLDGQCLRERWHDLSWLKKELLVRQVADFTAQLNRLQQSGLGSIYLTYQAASDDEDTVTDQSFQVGQAVQPTFFMEDHVRLPIYRGPFSSSNSLVTAHMQHLQHDISTQLRSDDQDEQEDAEEMQEIYNLLEPIIPRLFRPGSTIKESTSLFHPDLSANNILINDEGNLVGIVDWECVITAPPWLSCQLPEFLEGPSNTYLSCPDPVPSTDSEATEFYQEQLLNYEKASLRRFFLEEMGRVDAKWVETFRKESMRRDVLVAIELLSTGMRMGLVRGWVKAVKEGRTPKISLTDAIRKE